MKENFELSLFILGQLWNLIDGKLINKLNIWKSNDEWTFKPFEGSLFHIENISKSKVLGIASNEVVMETLAQNNQNQMWEISNNRFKQSTSAT